MKIKHLQPRRIKLPIKVMWISNSIHLPTGYANVSRAICTRLAQDSMFEIINVGMQHSSNPEKKDNITVLGIVQGKVFESIQEHIKQIRPDVIIILEDPFTMVNNKFHELELYGSKLMLYVAIDGNRLASTVEPIHRNADMNIGMAHFTTNQLIEKGFDAITIWHGSELDKYKPIRTKYQSKIKMLYGYEDNDKIFYSYFRNSGRKTPQTHMEIMASVLRELPSKYKYLIHCINADDKVNDLFDFRDRCLAEKYGKDVSDRIIISNQPVSKDTMVQYMQMCDYVIHAGSGEGYGLIIADALSCGKTIIANNFSTSDELLIQEWDGIGKRGIVVDPKYLLTSSYNVEHGHADKEAFKQTILDTVCNVNYSKEELEEMKKNGRKFAEKYLDWDTITNQFKEQIQKVI